MDLVGTVRPLVALEAPLSGAGCALYRVRLTWLQRVMEGFSPGGSSELTGAPFLLVCRLGEVLVDWTRATLHLEAARRHRVRLGRLPPRDERLAQLYRRLNRRAPRPRQRVSMLEQRLLAGERVWVQGPVERVPDVNGAPAGYRQPPARLVLQATELAALPS